MVVQSTDTGAARTVSSNQQGEYSIPSFSPGPYNITIEANGFLKPSTRMASCSRSRPTGTVAFRADRRQQHGNDHRGGEHATAQHLRCVGEHRDRQQVRGKPALERAQLQFPHRDTCPGSGADAGPLLRAGQFSVNGQRPDANYFMVDGVSANLGTAGFGANLGQGEEQASFRRPQRIWRGSATLCRWMRWKSSGLNSTCCAGIWPHAGSSNIVGGHQIGHECVSWHRVRILPQ